MRIAIPFLLSTTLLTGCGMSQKPVESTSTGAALVVFSSSSSPSAVARQSSASYSSFISSSAVPEQPTREEDQVFLRAIITEALTAADVMHMLLPSLPPDIQTQTEEAVTALRKQTVTLEAFHAAVRTRNLTTEERLIMSEEITLLQEGIDAFALMIEILTEDGSAEDATEEPER